MTPDNEWVDTIVNWTYTKDAHAEYIALSNRIGRGEVAKTKELREGLLVDLDSEGKIIGIEILTR